MLTSAQWWDEEMECFGSVSCIQVVRSFEVFYPSPINRNKRDVNDFLSKLHISGVSGMRHTINTIYPQQSNQSSYVYLKLFRQSPFRKIINYHLICQNTVYAMFIQWYHPVQSSNLVISHFASLYIWSESKPTINLSYLWNVMRREADG